MRAVDTSALVRLLAGDHPQQHARAFALFAGGDIWIPMSVMLETEWVLRGAYCAGAEDIASLFRSLFGVAGIEIENASAVAQALDWFERGMDFADALHLASSRNCVGLATFDRDLIKTAKRQGLTGVAEP
jgi:predicted nucleic-acid-binding protein